MAINRTSPKKGKIIDIPTVPTIGAATGGGGSASVAFTPATVGGPTFSYTALSNPGSITGTGTNSPVTVSGLTAGTSYTFTVRGTNPSGNSEYTSASNSVVPTVATAFESIATVTVGSGGSPEVEFTSIPATYTHLQIRYISRSENASDSTTIMRINSDTGNNYSTHRLYGNGSAAGSEGQNTVSFIELPRTAYGATGSNIFGGGVIDILDYLNTNKYKTIRLLGGCDENGSGAITFVSGLWQSTSAITAVNFLPSGGADMAEYTTFALYGIKEA